MRRHLQGATTGVGKDGVVDEDIDEEEDEEHLEDAERFEAKHNFRFEVHYTWYLGQNVDKLHVFIHLQLFQTLWGRLEK